jgi:hypothetical protein
MVSMIKRNGRAVRLSGLVFAWFLPPSVFKPGLVGLVTRGAVSIQLEAWNAIGLGLPTWHSEAGLVSPTIDPLLKETVPGFVHFPSCLLSPVDTTTHCNGKGICPEDVS